LLFDFFTSFIYQFDNSDNMNKVKVQLDEDVVTALIRLKNFGDTYSDVVRRLLKENSNE